MGSGGGDESGGDGGDGALLGGLGKGNFGWVRGVCIFFGEEIGGIVKGAIANGKVIGSTLKVPLIMTCFSDGYL